MNEIGQVLDHMSDADFYSMVLVIYMIGILLLGWLHGDK